MRVLVTGAAGFIGAALSERLLAQNHDVMGVDSFNDYYDVSLKQARHARLERYDTYRGERLDLMDREGLFECFRQFQPEQVVNLAAQPGVRYSLQNPYAYTDSNISGFLNILEACRQFSIKHLVFASSSSVYGSNRNMPFSVHHNVDHPVSLYAATKKANELMAHSYSHLYQLPVTGLRFFTVYGPWGRPDMAPFLFAKRILAGEQIDVFNYGKHRRDFTYIDDIVEGVMRVLRLPPDPDPEWSGERPDSASSNAAYRIYNIGHNEPVELMYFIELLEKNLGKKAKTRLLPMQPGDVEDTYADIDPLIEATGYRPDTGIESGVKSFVEWYIQYYGHA